MYIGNEESTLGRFRKVGWIDIQKSNKILRIDGS